MYTINTFILNTLLNKYLKKIITTLGPNGQLGICYLDENRKNVYISKDGYLLFKRFYSKQKTINQLIIYIKEILFKQNIVGDGTTSLLVLLSSMIEQFIQIKIKLINNFELGVKKGIEDVLKKLKNKIIKINSNCLKFKCLLNTVSNKDDEIVDNVLMIFKKIKKNENMPIFFLEKKDPSYSLSSKTKIYFESGFKVNIKSHNLENYSINKIINLKNINIIIYKGKIFSFQQSDVLCECIKKYFSKKCNLIIIAEEFHNEILKLVNSNNNLYGDNVMLFEIDFNHLYIDDLLALSNIKEVISEASIINNLNNYIGKIDSIKISDNQIVLFSHNENNKNLNIHLNELKKQINESSNIKIKNDLDARLQNFYNNIVKIVVLGQTFANVLEKGDRYEDTIKVAKSSLKNGVILGGGLTLKTIYDELINNIKNINDNDFLKGYKIIVNACLSIFKQLNFKNTEQCYDDYISTKTSLELSTECFLTILKLNFSI